MENEGLKKILVPLGTTSAGITAFGYLGSSAQTVSGGSETFNATTVEIANGGSLPTTLTTTFGPSSGSGGSSSEDPDAILIIFKNDLPYDVVEKRAKEVYDSYDKNHDKTSDAGASLVMTSNQAKELYDTLVGDKSPEALIEELEVAKKVYKKSI